MSDVLPPLLSLGCKVEVRRLEGLTEYEVARLCRSSGGAPLQPLCLEEGMFAAERMEAMPQVAFEEMKVKELQAELAAHDVGKGGRKAALQHRLHALTVQAEVCKRARQRWRSLTRMAWARAMMATAMRVMQLMWVGRGGAAAVAQRPSRQHQGRRLRSRLQGRRLSGAGSSGQQHWRRCGQR